MKKLVTAAAALLTLMLAWPAAAQFAKPEDAIKYRKASFTVMGAHFGRVGAMAAGRVPYDAKAAAENADIAAAMSKLPWAAFPEGSDKGETRAKPEIWKDSAKFKEAADKMQA
ncbi:MAG: cytochrome c, partial [Betaproteobacteria bacterium]|nr:cytochrome c [Betaproteobacteria bacterium]